MCEQRALQNYVSQRATKSSAIALIAGSFNSMFTPPTRTRQTVNGGVNTTPDKTRQFCVVSTQFPVSKFSAILNIFETEQLQIGNWVEARRNCLVLSAVVFTAPTRTRQDKTVLSCPHVGGVNKL